MSSSIPADVRDLLVRQEVKFLSTLMSDGSPHLSPVWADVEGDIIQVNSQEGRVKVSNVRRDPRVAITVTDPDNPYVGAQIRGRVVEITTEGAEDHIDLLGRRYLGENYRPGRFGDNRVLVRIEADTASKFG